MSAVPQSGILWMPMQEADLAEVHAIERAAYEFPWTEGNFRDSIAARYQCWVCREGSSGVEAILGYFVLMIGVGEAHLLNLCVAVQRQRRGYGRYLLDNAIEVARGQGAETFILEVRPSNLAGRRLYARAGFHEIGKRRSYYPDRQGREDAIVMAQKLA